MATPAFRAAGTAVFSANNVANPTALAPTKSGSTVNGDLMLCITECRSITATVATPTGWTLLTGFPIRSGTASGGSVYVFSRIATGGADDAPSISWSGVTTGTNGDSCGARILAWSGAVETQAGTVTSTDAASTTTVTMPAITTTFGNALIVGVVVKINDTVHTWTVATRTERSDDHTTTGTGHGTVTCDLVQTAVGASGTSVATPSTTVSSRTLAISIAMKPVVVTATVNQITETDTARRLAVPFGRATETDTARAVAVGGVHVLRVTETETAQALTHTKKRAIGQASDTETARPVVRYNAYDTAIDLDSPISHFKLGEASGTTAVDRKGVQNGTYTNTGSVTLGRPGAFSGGNNGDTAVLFDSDGVTSGFVTAPWIGAYDVANKSLEAWFKIASDWRGVAQKVISDSDLSIDFDSSRILVGNVSSGGLNFDVTSTTVLALDTWYHVVLTFDGDDAKLYLNARLVKTRHFSPAKVLDDISATALRISKAGSEGLEGEADEAAIYGTALPLASVQNHYVAGGGSLVLSAAVAQASETDTAQALTHRKTLAIAQASDAETAQALTRTKKRAIGQASDTETARGVYASPYDATIDADSPISHWKLGETSGTTAFDRKGVSDGTLSNPTEYTLGQPGLATRNAGDKAILFQETGGTTGYITIFDPGAPYDVTRVSLEAWVKLASDAAARTQRVVNGSSWKLEVSSARKARFYAKVSGVTQQVTGTTTLSLSTRYHLAGTYDGQFLRIYVNGALDGTLDLGVVTDLDASTTVISISNSDSVLSFEGTADEVALYGSALALARIQAHFDAGRAIFLSVAGATETDTAGAITARKTLAIGQASETDTARTMVIVDPILRAIAQASDTETAGALTRVKTKAIGQASDTETAAILTPVQTSNGQTIAVGRATETDSAGATTARKTLAIGQASDSETAGATGRLKTKAIAQASDTETAQATTSRKTRAIAQAVETDTAQALARLKTKAIAQTSDTETATAVARSKTKAIAQASDAETARTMVIVDPILRVLGQASDTETPGALTHTKTLAIAQASEANTARTMVIVDPILRAIAQAVEADSATATTVSKLKAITQAVETQTARVLVGLKTRALGRASESDTATTTAAIRSIPVARASEADTSTPLAHSKVLAILRASEADSATALATRKTVAVGLALEASIAQVLGRLKALLLGQSTETDTATSVAGSKAHAVAQAVEADSAFNVSIRGRIAQVQETSVARAISRLKTLASAAATEADSASALAALKRLLLGRTTETDSATGVASSKLKAVGLASEADSSAPVTPLQSKLIAVNQAEEADATLSLVGRHTVTLGKALEDATAGAIVAPFFIMVHRAFETNSARPVSVLSTAPVSRRVITGTILRPVETVAEGQITFAGRSISGTTAARSSTIRTGSIDR